MPLKLDGENQSLFSHNRDYDEGVKQRGIRPGQATVVVALDGSGDAETIQEGINLLPPEGGEVKIKEGTYKITKKIIIDSNTQLSGTGRQTIILKTGNIKYVIIENKTRTGAGNENILIKNLSFKNDNAISAYKDHGIDLNTVSGCTIENNQFIGANSLNDAIKITDSTHITIINNLFKQSFWAITHLINSSNNIIMANTILSSNSVFEGIDIDLNSHRNTIAQNILIFDASGYYGIQIAGNENIVSNNQIENITEGPALTILAAADRTLVIGNISYNNSGGNYSNAGTNTTASGNIFA